MNRGYFADMKEFKEHGGKVMMQLLSLCFIGRGHNQRLEILFSCCNGINVPIFKGGLLSLALWLISYISFWLLM